MGSSVVALCIFGCRSAFPRRDQTAQRPGSRSCQLARCRRERYRAVLHGCDLVMSGISRLELSRAWSEVWVVGVYSPGKSSVLAARPNNPSLSFFFLSLSNRVTCAIDRKLSYVIPDSQVVGWWWRGWREEDSQEIRQSASVCRVGPGRGPRESQCHQFVDRRHLCRRHAQHQHRHWHHQHHRDLCLVTCWRVTSQARCYRKGLRMWVDVEVLEDIFIM